MDFKLVSDYKAAGDQGRAIEELSRGLYAGEKHQVLLGVTGSGKTYTMAKVIERFNRPALVLAHPLPDEMFDIVFEKQDRYAIAQGDIGRRGKEISDANIDRTAVDPALHLIRQRRDSAFPKVCRIGREP